MKYWIDTDPGVDDAIAIILAAKYLGNDIVGLSSVQGNFIEPITAKNLARIVNKIKSANITPNNWNPIISRGSPKALGGVPYRSPDYAGDSYHGRDGLAEVNWEAGISINQNIIFAANSIVSAAHKYPGMALICIGPLTNIALALQLDPSLPKYISEMTIMGGNIYAQGNETTSAEFNFMADPEAARMVFEAGFGNLKLIPIDPCLNVKFYLSDINRMKSTSSSTAQLISELTNIWEQQLQRGDGIVIYDVVALIISLFQELPVWKFFSISIDIDEYRGKVNFSKTQEIYANAQVAMEIRDRNTFFSKLEYLLEDVG